MKQTKGDTASFTGTLKSPIMTIFPSEPTSGFKTLIVSFSNQPVNVFDICRTLQLAADLFRQAVSETIFFEVWALLGHKVPVVLSISANTPELILPCCPTDKPQIRSELGSKVIRCILL